jgi:LmbE family N-acetylglucosaminyl deacetylase
MAKWSAGGGEVHVVMMTNNCSGNLIPPDGDESRIARLPPAATSAARRREQEEAARLIGARVHFLDFWQRHYWNGTRVVDVGYEAAEGYPDGLKREPCILIACNEADHIERLGRLMAGLAPTLVLTQTPLDVDPEHHAVAAMVWTAFLRTPALHGVPLRFWTPSSGSPGGLADAQYDRIEDIGAFYDMKVRLCAAHASQWSARRRRIVERRALHWGQRIGVLYGEPFRSAWWRDETAQGWPSQSFDGRAKSQGG